MNDWEGRHCRVCTHEAREHYYEPDGTIGACETCECAAYRATLLDLATNYWTTVPDSVWLE